MKHKGILLFAVLLFVVLAFGCSTKRFVTATHWYDNEHMYVSYFENKSGEVGPKVIKCDLQAGNSMTCAEQTDVNRLTLPE